MLMSEGTYSNVGAHFDYYHEKLTSSFVLGLLYKYGKCEIHFARSCSRNAFGR